MDLALNNQQRLICHKTQPANQPTKTSRETTTQNKLFWMYNERDFSLLT